MPSMAQTTSNLPFLPGGVVRDYARIVPSFWMGQTGRKLRAAGPECQLVALYLMSAPTSNMLGLYYLPLPTLAHETGIPLEGASEALRSLSQAGFAYYDEDREEVWIPEMARYQIADELDPKDNRVKNIERELKSYTESRFYPEFLRRYSTAFQLSLPIPSEAPSKGLRSQEQEQEQEQDRSGSRTREEPPPLGAGGADQDEAPFDSYTRIVCGLHVELRGAGSPTPNDERLAREWFEAGIPLSTVVAAMRTVAAKRRDRGGRGRIGSLAYYRDAVEEAAAALREFQGPAMGLAAPTFDAEAILEALAARLPPAFAEFAPRVLALAQLGDIERIEAELSGGLDQELVDSAWKRMTPAEQSDVCEVVTRTIQTLRAAGRLGEERLAEETQSLRIRVIRQMGEIPALSLLSPMTETGEWS